MWGSMLKGLTNHSSPNATRLSHYAAGGCPIGHHPLASCAASADVSQLDILLCQCRILKKRRRHRQDAGPRWQPGNILLCAWPMQNPTDYRPSASGWSSWSLFPGTDWASNYLTAPPLLSAGLKWPGVGGCIDLIRWRRRSNIPTIIPVASAIWRCCLLFQRGRGMAGRSGPLPVPMQLSPSWESVQELAGALSALVFWGSGSSSPDPVAGFPFRARIWAKWLSGWLAKRFTYQVSERTGAPTGQPTSADTGLETLPHRSCSERPMILREGGRGRRDDLFFLFGFNPAQSRSPS